MQLCSRLRSRAPVLRCVRALSTLPEVPTESCSHLLAGRRPLDHRPGMMPGLGAIIEGVDLSAPFTDLEVEALLQASDEAGGILVFPNQKPTFTIDEHLAFGRRLGVLEPHAVALGLPGYPEVLEIVREPGAGVVFGEDWHSDNSFMKRTCSYSILRATACMPRRGANDTMFASTEAAYAALSPLMQERLQGLYAYHSAGKAYDGGSQTNSRAAMEATKSMQLNDKAPILKEDVLQPVVVAHPRTGRPSLFVSPTFTRHIHGMHPEESAALLEFLYKWIARPEFCTRVSWEPHQVTMWDNRCLSHKGLADDVSERRVVHRVSIRGTSPAPFQAQH
ncbi:hypothetical protein AB1Y20_000568 [Prymnesium parvum]|uniref:TauD/TfdA-like domain-containing protein n=1 Tax=Prymnesium parvum TaxID=97485 RepID=A0AB34K5R7_PRYPA